MGTYILRRLLQMVPVFLGATFIIFYLVVEMPGDPLASLCGEKGCSPGVAAQLREQFNLDGSFLERYMTYMKGVVTFDFGQTFTQRSVVTVMSEAFPVTVKLALMAFAIEIFIGIPLGLLAGMLRGKVIDGAILLMTLIIISIPIFVTGFVAQFFFGVKLQWVRATVRPGDPLIDLVLPAIVLGSLSVAYITRLTRTSVAENSRADYVRTATSKGLPRRRVVVTHLLRNSMIPVVTFLGADLGSLMGGAIVTEGIFNVHGVGNTLYNAIIKGEAPTVVGFVTVLVLVYLFANLIVDLLYAVLDPRIRYE